jgi:hypothetical protein
LYSNNKFVCVYHGDQLFHHEEIQGSIKYFQKIE